MRKNLYSLLFVLVSFSAFSQTNYALSFNGTSNYVSIGTPIATGSSYTKEAWVFLNSSTGARNIISSQNTPLWIDNGVLKGGQAGTYDLVIDPTSFPLNTWTHVAITYTAGTNSLRLYRDGALVASSNTTPSYTSEATYIASHYGTASFFSGSIDEVRIWSTALSSSQLKQNMLKGPATNAAGLRAYYNCNAGSGTTLMNVCTNGTGTNGTISGASWTASPVKFSSSALNFDGTDDYIAIAKPLVAGSSYTKEAWVYVTKNITLPGNIVSSTNSPFWVSGNRLRAGNNNSTADVIDNTDFPTNTWVHVAVTFNGVTGVMRLYRNGVQVASGTGTTNYLNQDNYIGAWYNSATPGTESYWGGSIDEVRIWNTVRSQAEIQANMQNELDPADASQTSGLMAYYTFNQGVTAGSNTSLSTLLDQKNTFNGSLKNFSLTGATSNYVTQQASLVVLPVKWISFTATAHAGKAMLEWQTAEESAAFGYTVQHSTNGSQWTSVSTVPVGSNSRANTYRFTHNGLQNGLNFYRIAVQDKDGKMSHSSIRTVNMAAERATFRVYGNSLHSSLTVDVLNPCTLSLFDQSGKRMLQGAFKQGLHVIDVSRLAKGIYLLNAEGKTERILLQ